MRGGVFLAEETAQGLTILRPDRALAQNMLAVSEHGEKRSWEAGEAGGAGLWVLLPGLQVT